MIGNFITLEAEKMGSLKVKIFEDGPDTLVWKIVVECNPVKSSREVKLNSKNVLSILSRLFKDNNNLNQNHNSEDLNQNCQDNEKSDRNFCGEFVYEIIGIKKDEEETVLDFLTFELESRQNEEFTFECQRCHAFSSGSSLFFPSNRQHKICENCEQNLVPKNIGLDHSYCSHNKDFDEFKKDFDQQITKNGINQNHISDENSFKNAEIIFENDADSMPKSSKPTNIKKTKSLIENLENKDLDLSSRKTFLAMKRKLILKRIESEIKVNEAQISIHQKTEEVQDAILKNELLKMQTLQEKMLNRPKKQFQKKQEKMCE